MTTLQANVGGFQAEVESVREQLRDGQLGAIREVLTDGIILRACAELGLAFRERVLTPVVTVLHMIAAAFGSNATTRSEGSFSGAWKLHGSEPVSSAALARARGRLPEGLWRSLHTTVSGIAANASAPWAVWCGHRVVDLDGTCVSMEDNPALKETFGVSKGRHGLGRYPLARMVVAILWGTMTILEYAVGGYVSSEWALATQALAGLLPGDLVVGDRCFAGAHYYAIYLARGLQFVTRAHQRLIVNRLPRIMESSPDDFITTLQINPHYRREDPTLPETVTVRMIRVEARIRGKFGFMWLVTSLLDQTKYPASGIARLYAGRWRIETAFRELKVVCGADVLRSKTPEGIRKEIAARVIAVNLVRTIMIDAARRHGCEPTRLSFSGALRAVASTSIRMSAAPVYDLMALYELMLAGIAADVVPDRPDRDEPRAVCRERKHYPHLRGPRAEWRLAHAKA